MATSRSHSRLRRSPSGAKMLDGRARGAEPNLRRLVSEMEAQKRAEERRRAAEEARDGADKENLGSTTGGESAQGAQGRAGRPVPSGPLPGPTRAEIEAAVDELVGPDLYAPGRIGRQWRERYGEAVLDLLVQRWQERLETS